MTAPPVNLRNLEQIQEGARGRSPKVATFLLAASGSAAVFLAMMLLDEREPKNEEKPADPLATLVERSRGEEEETRQLGAEELDFPEVLSDADSRTTALVAVKDKSGRLVKKKEEAKPTPVEADGLPAKPLPAGTMLNQTPVTKEPKDQLTQVATEAAKVDPEAEVSPPGSEGGFVIQVASFKDQDDADRFVAELRKRGHEAFRQAATVPDRGVWHRVRIGSFKTKYRATLYKKKLEKDERVTALVIDPDKVKRQERVRAAKVAERIRKYGRQ